MLLQMVMKRTPVDDFPTKKRGGKGVIAIKTSERNGELVGAVAIDESKELMLISDGGTLVRTRASEVARTGRNAQGVRLIRLGNEEIWSVSLLLKQLKSKMIF